MVRSVSEVDRPVAIVLVGLMGSGKTTVGKKVARILGWDFIDADVELERRSGRPVAAWFAEDGEEAFREAEADLLASVLDEAAPDRRVVLGAGGGVVVTKRNRKRLKATDVASVYLHADPGFLASRTQAKPHRPLLSGDPLAVLAKMYEDRDPRYREVADAVVEVPPAHEIGEKPKWRLAEDVVEALAAIGLVDAPDELDEPADTEIKEPQP